MAIGFFVTGTDTGIGKTVVSCALLHAFAAQGHTVIGMKPVAAGRENGVWQDVENLKAASNISMPQSLINPYAFVEPVAPHIAAQQTGITIDPEVIRQACEQLQAAAEVTIVEGVGGFRVPLSLAGIPDCRYDTGDLASVLGLPVILAVGMRLGCLNHALLTARAIESTGLKLAGWVANVIDPAMLQLEINLQTLAEWLDCPLLGVLPFQEQLDVRQLAGLIDLSRLG
ncbi:dethiobiotin synthase [Nitrosomonas sp.]|uniref:dethiobiotin synthase n=1 Tax=Nitrosomonas sp. TaxID=42353 RepID=UPI0025E77DBD|nr:dethiobiotin synthase [Nitrosomonas sp.]MCC6916302.1 dethiobiotin synthase [Nitrosomonas sp.]